MPMPKAMVATTMRQRSDDQLSSASVFALFCTSDGTQNTTGKEAW